MIAKTVSLSELESLASDFVRTLNKGAVVYMMGDLGAGKTTFVRAAIQSILGHDEAVPSPTFTLVQTYDSIPPIWHYDLYRINDPEEVLELGMDEAFDQGITFIEWPQNMRNVYTPKHYRVMLETTTNPEHRSITISAP
ncbi:tRNA (adenosine(37)-N6)-threonylcarbamoyltransferase complex ATPase subunit type 1 TsaE [Candidatus Bodocaedibacter vickermanii]|uniref:tRNA threonylcarbamoyladenosine biosynthesis protein TsaE n=1 Tax=Candidatus Bodocaedibacter vickermanii TaxID=2741701 RepID=A0A7L9RSJ0_9PROT|nr:tRNA threonylcarbamoyladenosine biosynthesis protein TsaE [Candidatus Paracaedibacteraceae bacterium 'Lake Konstanz']